MHRCGTSGTGALAMYISGAWYIFTPSCLLPLLPSAGTHVAAPIQIVWNWNPVSDATGYRWSATNNFASATDLGNATSKTETGLTCNTLYTRYVWSYNACGNSTATTLTQSTSPNQPAAPSAGTHVASPNQIVWNWNTVPNATGYKWNTTNNYATASDMGTGTSKTETGLSCLTLYTRYVWAYNTCGVSVATTLTKTTTGTVINAPTEGIHIPSLTEIAWKWNAVAGATGYKWSTTNDFGTAVDAGVNLQVVETGLTCNTNYTRFIWAYNECGNSTSTIITSATLSSSLNTPTAGTHVPGPTQIVWNWSTVAGATGYMWNTTNNYATAIDMGTATSKTETGLTCNTPYTRYAWAYSVCGNSTTVILTQSTSPNPPAAPTAGTHVPGPTQIVWNWSTVTGATGYKWNTTNDYATATDMGTATTKTETGLTCNTPYTRYAWAYNTCGNSTAITLTQSTTTNPPAAPTAGTHVPGPTQIVWNWSTVTGATGYKWNTTNNYATATDMGTATTKTETELTCNTPYTRYAWTYNSCGNSTALTLNQTTSSCSFTCGSSLVINHVTGAVAPVTKTVTYGTVTNIPGEASKCWITSNLGADHQASAKNDATEASAGWYWQFNRQQGYKHDGTTRTPNTTWITPINENSDWIIANDPCTLELGAGWRIPTSTEWTNADASGGWTNWNGPWDSGLKLHAAGYLHAYMGSLLLGRGTEGLYWSSSQYSSGFGYYFYLVAYGSEVNFTPKAGGFTLRCLKE